MQEILLTGCIVQESTISHRKLLMIFLWDKRYFNKKSKSIYALPLHTIYYWFLFISERVEVIEKSTTQQKLTLYELEKYQNYTIQVVASTKVGQGLKSRSIYCRTQEDGKCFHTNTDYCH